MIKGGKNCCVLNGTFDEIYVRNWKCDTEMSDESPRPVQNKVIKKYVDEMLAKMDADIDTINDSIGEIKREVGEIKNNSNIMLEYF